MDTFPVLKHVQYTVTQIIVTAEAELTVLYMRYCRWDFALNTLSEPEEPRGLMIWVRSRKSLKRKPYSSLLLLAL